jgi:hypothetical protein
VIFVDSEGNLVKDGFESIVESETGGFDHKKTPIYIGVRKNYFFLLICWEKQAHP